MDENFRYKRNLKKIKCKIVNQTSVNSCFYWPEMLPENIQVSPNPDWSPRQEDGHWAAIKVKLVR